MCRVKHEKRYDSINSRINSHIKSSINSHINSHINSNINSNINSHSIRSAKKGGTISFYKSIGTFYCLCHLMRCVFCFFSLFWGVSGIFGLIRIPSGYKLLVIL